VSVDIDDHVQVEYLERERSFHCDFIESASKEETVCADVMHNGSCK